MKLYQVKIQFFESEEEIGDWTDVDHMVYKTKKRAAFEAIGLEGRNCAKGNNCNCRVVEFDGCGDCGAKGETIGHMGCEYAEDHP